MQPPRRPSRRPPSTARRSSATAARGRSPSRRTTAAPRGAALGKALFFDPRLSRSRDISCATCHIPERGWEDARPTAVGTRGFHDIGVAEADSGRGTLVPGLDVLAFAHKTPTLRNADRRAPYVHDGTERTLDEVIDPYDRGGRVRRPSLSPELRPLGLTRGERADLAAFLRTLTSEHPPAHAPTLPR